MSKRNNVNDRRNSNYNKGRNNRNTNSSGDYKKHTGCKIYGKGDVILTAWNWTQANGMVSIMVLRTKNSKEGVTEKGSRWITVAFKVTPKRGAEYWKYGFYYPDTQIAYCKDMDMIFDPNAPRGGYAGTPYRDK